MILLDGTILLALYHMRNSFTTVRGHSNDDSPAHHLKLSIFLMVPVMKRIIIEFHDYVLQKVSSLSQLNDQISFTKHDIPSNSFDLNKTHSYQLIPALQQFKSITKSI